MVESVDIHIWEIKSGDIVRTTQVDKTLTALYQSPPSGYKFELYSPEILFTQDKPEKNRIYFVMGADLDHLVGYANCFTHRAAKKVEDASALLACEEDTELMDCNGKTILPRLLNSYDGYTQYTGKGEVLYIAQLEVFQRRQKYGSRLLQHLQSQSYGLIEIEASHKYHLPFLKTHGFVFTGLEKEEDEHIMVWPNPMYAKSTAKILQK